MGSSGPAWVLQREGTLGGLEKRWRKEKNGGPKRRREGKRGWDWLGPTWGLSWGHSGSAGSSSPIEEGKQILITSSTSHTKGPRNARAGGLAGRTTQASTTNETPPTGAFPPTTACECSFQFRVQTPVYVDLQVKLDVGANNPGNCLKAVEEAASIEQSGERWTHANLPHLASPLCTLSPFLPILRPLGISRVAATEETTTTKKKNTPPPGTLVGGAIWSRPRLAIGPAVGTRAASVPLFNERIWANIWLPGGGAATPRRPARVLPLLFKPGGIKGGPWISKVTKP